MHNEERDCELVRMPVACAHELRGDRQAHKGVAVVASVQI